MKHAKSNPVAAAPVIEAAPPVDASALYAETHAEQAASNLPRETIDSTAVTGELQTAYAAEPITALSIFKAARTQAIDATYTYLTAEERSALAEGFQQFLISSIATDVTGNYGEQWKVGLVIEGGERERHLTLGMNPYRNEFFGEIKRVIESNPGMVIPGWRLRMIESPKGLAFDLVPFGMSDDEIDNMILEPAKKAPALTR